MKVRHKTMGMIIEHARRVDGKIIHELADSPYVELDMTVWEIVNDEPRWQDVTGECEAYGGKLFVQMGPHAVPLPNTPDNYRLRKVQLWNEDSTKLRYAFIVERKVSD